MKNFEPRLKRFLDLPVTQYVDNSEATYFEAVKLINHLLGILQKYETPTAVVKLSPEMEMARIMMNNIRVRTDIKHFPHIDIADCLKAANEIARKIKLNTPPSA